MAGSAEAMGIHPSCGLGYLVDMIIAPRQTGQIETWCELCDPELALPRNMTWVEI